MTRPDARRARQRFLLYGAAGYSGQLIARAALAAGLEPVLSGREDARIFALAAELKLEYRAASLRDAAGLDRALKDLPLVLHCAGPFSDTSMPMFEACLRARAHYLDLTGEIDVVERMAANGHRAREKGIMAMCGVGLDVVAGDCLSLHVVSRVRRPSRLAIGVQGLRLVSRGTAKTIVEAAGSGRCRRDGKLRDVAIGSIRRSFDFGLGPIECWNVSWADVSTSYFTTGVPFIDVFCEAIAPLRWMSLSNRLVGQVMRSDWAQIWLKSHIDMMPPGPDGEARASASAVFVAEATNTSGGRASSRLRTPEAYTFTAMVAPEIVSRVLTGDFEAGFQTPARIYGAEFPLSFSGVVREELT